MAIKVDFDLTMTILVHNLYRLFAMGLIGFAHCDAAAIFDKFISNARESIIKKEKKNVPLFFSYITAGFSYKPLLLHPSRSHKPDCDVDFHFLHR